MRGYAGWQRVSYARISSMRLITSMEYSIRTSQSGRSHMKGLHDLADERCLAALAVSDRIIYFVKRTCLNAIYVRRTVDRGKATAGRRCLHCSDAPHHPATLMGVCISPLRGLKTKRKPSYRGPVCERLTRWIAGTHDIPVLVGAFGLMVDIWTNELSASSKRADIRVPIRNMLPIDIRTRARDAATHDSNRWL